jgi:hypothetical protein
MHPTNHKLAASAMTQFAKSHLGTPKSRARGESNQRPNSNNSPPTSSPPHWCALEPPPPQRSPPSPPRYHQDRGNYERSLEHSFKALGLGLGATETEVKVRHPMLAQIYHPDKFDPSQTGLTQLEASQWRECGGAIPPCKRISAAPADTLPSSDDCSFPWSLLQTTCSTLWLTTSFNDAMIISPEGLDHVPPGVRDILTIIGNAASAIYVREPLHNGQDHINILLDNLRSSTIDPPSRSFEDIVVSWFKELLLRDSQANNKTGVDSQILQAYRFALEKHNSLLVFISKITQQNGFYV